MSIDGLRFESSVLVEQSPCIFRMQFLLDATNKSGESASLKCITCPFVKGLVAFLPIAIQGSYIASGGLSFRATLTVLRESQVIVEPLAIFLLQRNIGTKRLGFDCSAYTQLGNSDEMRTAITTRLLFEVGACIGFV